MFFEVFILKFFSSDVYVPDELYFHEHCAMDYDKQTSGVCVDTCRVMWLWHVIVRKCNSMYSFMFCNLKVIRWGLKIWGEPYPNKGADFEKKSLVLQMYFQIWVEGKSNGEIFGELSPHFQI